MGDIIEKPELRNKTHIFDDRTHAGDLVAELLQENENRKDTIILAIPAGGVPVANQISKKLNLSWDLAITRKLHIPWNQEAGFGAVSWDGTAIINRPLADSLGLTKKEINRVIEEEKQILQRRLKKFRGNAPFPVIKNKVVILVDDGLASGFSMLVTARTLSNKVKKVVVAVPTAPTTAINLIQSEVDKIVCVNIRSTPFFAVADAYKLWYDLTDDDVIGLLKQSDHLRYNFFNE